jgi:hypothetical protein
LSLRENAKVLNEGSYIGKLLIAQQKKWLAQGDDFRTFLGEFVSSLPQVELFGAF